jgi:U3 small nucleolar RNA-associated protein 12
MKTYLRYIPTDSFGIIVSPQCPDLLTDASGKLAITAALQDVCVFNLRQGSKVGLGNKQLLTVPCEAPGG